MRDGPTLTQTLAYRVRNRKCNAARAAHVHDVIYKFECTDLMQYWHVNCCRKTSSAGPDIGSEYDGV